MKKRLSIAFIIIIIVSIVFCGLFITISYRQSYFSEAENNLKKSGNFIMNYLLPVFLETGNPENLDHYADSTEFRVTITNATGDVIYESPKGLDAIENHKKAVTTR